MIDWSQYQTMSLDSLVGLNDAKEQLKRDLTLRSLRDQPQKMVLLEGCSGTAKSTVILSMVKDFMTRYPDRFEFFELRSDKVTGQVTAISEKVREFWDKIRRLNKPLILFVDEADDVFASRKNAGHIKQTRTIALLLELNKTIPNLYIIAATNRPMMIDGAILDRFNNRINCPLPTDEEMKQIIDIHLPFLIEHQRNVLHQSIIQSDYKWNGRDLRHMHEELLEIIDYEQLTHIDYQISVNDVVKVFAKIERSKCHQKDDYLDEGILKIEE